MQTTSHLHEKVRTHKTYSSFREDEEISELAHCGLVLPDHLLYLSHLPPPLPTMKRWKGQSQQP